MGWTCRLVGDDNFAITAVEPDDGRVIMWACVVDRMSLIPCVDDSVGVVCNVATVIESIAVLGTLRRPPDSGLERLEDRNRYWAVGGRDHRRHSPCMFFSSRASFGVVVQPSLPRWQRKTLFFSFVRYGAACVSSRYAGPMLVLVDVLHAFAVSLLSMHTGIGSHRVQPRLRKI